MHSIPLTRIELDRSTLRIISRSKEDIQNPQSKPHRLIIERGRFIMSDKADNPINSGMHAGCVDDALVSMDLSEEERSKLLQVMAKAKVW